MTEAEWLACRTRPRWPQFTANPLETHAVAADLIRQLDRDYDALYQGDLGTLEASWKEHLGLLGKQVVAECHDGTFRGRLRDMSSHGVELLRADGASLVLSPERTQHLSEAGEQLGN